jgi:glucokinase
MSTALHLGIDLGGTKIAAGLVTPAGEVLGRTVRPTPGGGPAPVIAALADVAFAAAQAAGVDLHDVPAIGIGAPGPIDDRAGVVVNPPNLPGWQNVALARDLAARVGRPCLLGNDANLAGLAEYRFGAGQGSALLVYLTVSTGIGGGVVIGGRLLTGVSGAAGELGHVIVRPDGPSCGCGNRGCLEALASGTAIAHRAEELIRRGVPGALTDRFARRPGRVTAADVAAAAQAGDAEAARILARALDDLGLGVAGLVNVFNPDRVVIGGGLSRLGETLLDPVRRAVRRTANAVAALAVKIVPAALGADSGVLGAAALAMGPGPARQKLAPSGKAATVRPKGGPRRGR